jgi:hypothetical protein
VKPERFFRYVPTERANAWEQAGWNVISSSLSMRAPLDADDPAIDVVIVEWLRAGQPVEPMRSRATAPSDPKC